MVRAQPRGAALSLQVLRRAGSLKCEDLAHSIALFAMVSQAAASFLAVHAKDTTINSGPGLWSCAWFSERPWKCVQDITFANFFGVKHLGKITGSVAPAALVQLVGNLLSCSYSGLCGTQLAGGWQYMFLRSFVCPVSLGFYEPAVLEAATSSSVYSSIKQQNLKQTNLIHDQ
jgi:hypothetical protein